MRMDRIPSDARAATGARPRRVDPSVPGADGAPGGATRRAWSGRPSGLPMTRGRSSPEPFPGDEVEIESRLVLENAPALIPPLLARLREAADRLGLFDARTADGVALALTEALINAIHHGNLELD